MAEVAVLIMLVDTCVPACPYCSLWDRIVIAFPPPKVEIAEKDFSKLLSSPNFAKVLRLSLPPLRRLPSKAYRYQVDGPIVFPLLPEHIAPII
jgi:hypothetical protein